MKLVERAKNIMLSPKTEWDVVANEEPNIKKIIIGYVIPLVLISAIASVIGFGTPVIIGIVQTIAVIFFQVMSVFILAFVVNIFAPIFGSQKNRVRAVQLIAYSMTPIWIGGIVISIGVVVNIYPLLLILNVLFVLYGLNLLYLGIAPLLQIPKNKKVGYFIVSIVVMIVIYSLVEQIYQAIAGAIIMAVGVSIYG